MIIKVVFYIILMNQIIKVVKNVCKINRKLKKRIINKSINIKTSE